MLTSAILSDLYPALNASGAGDLQWWTVAQLYSYMSDELQKIDGAVPVFAAVQSATTTTARNTLAPAGTTAVVAAAWNQTSLRPATVAELEALDPGWETVATATPRRWTEDLGPGTIRLYPGPHSSGQLQIVHHGSAPRVSGGDVAIPAIFSEFLWLSTLAAARKQTGETYLPDVATAAEAQAALLLQVAKGYWGSAL